MATTSLRSEGWNKLIRTQITRSTLSSIRSHVVKPQQLHATKPAWWLQAAKPWSSTNVEKHRLIIWVSEPAVFAPFGTFHAPRTIRSFNFGDWHQELNFHIDGHCTTDHALIRILRWSAAIRPPTFERLKGFCSPNHVNDTSSQSRQSIRDPLISSSLSKPALAPPDVRRFRPILDSQLGTTPATSSPDSIRPTHYSPQAIQYDQANDGA